MDGVPHFDREGHFRTQEQNSRRWQRRGYGRDRDGHEMPGVDVPRGTLANFLFVGGIISLGVFVPTFLFEKSATRNKKD